jgi:hypothetical protein
VPDDQHAASAVFRQCSLRGKSRVIRGHDDHRDAETVCKRPHRVLGAPEFADDDCVEALPLRGAAEQLRQLDGPRFPGRCERRSLSCGSAVCFSAWRIT